MTAKDYVIDELDRQQAEFTKEWRDALKWVRGFLDQNQSLEDKLISLQGYSIVEKLLKMVEEIDDDWRVVRRVLMMPGGDEVTVDEKDADICNGFVPKMEAFNVEHDRMIAELKDYIKRYKKGDLR